MRHGTPYSQRFDGVQARSKRWLISYDKQPRKRRTRACTAHRTRHAARESNGGRQCHGTKHRTTRRKRTVVVNIRAFYSLPFSIHLPASGYIKHTLHQECAVHNMCAVQTVVPYLLRMRPCGTESKKDMGARSTERSSASWVWAAACIPGGRWVN